MKITDLQPSLVFNIFDQITKVPRPSKKEEKIRAFLVNFAKEHGIEVKTDAIGNVEYLKPATPGCEDAPVVIMQGHMDMVCEKNGDIEHDFDNDPIQTIVDGEWVRANGTTLGADNGIGLAAAMAVMLDDSIKHGPIKALFTVDEETGLTGATNIAPDMIEGDLLLNLDSEEEAFIIIGCAGGLGTTATFNYKEAATPAGYQFFKIDFTNLLGGHSGTDIDKGRACANKVLARFITNLAKETKVEIADIDGGNLRNAIAREAHVTLGVPSADKEKVVVMLNEYKAIIDAEYKGIENINITWESIDAPATCIENKVAMAVVSALYATPHGVQSMCMDIPGLVESSTNLASVKMDKEAKTITINTSQRSAVTSRKHDVANYVEEVFKLAGADTIEHSGEYPGWQPNVESPLLKLATKAYEDLYNITPQAIALHAGLECGYFLTMYPHMDMISFGPTLLDVHSPKEAMHIPAVEKFWNHLKRILEMIAEKKK